MNPEIRDIILSAFSLLYLGVSNPEEGELENDLNCDDFYFIQNKKSLVVGRNSLGSTTTVTFSDAKLTPDSLACDITVALGDRKLAKNSVRFVKNAQYSVEQLLRLFIKRHIKEVKCCISNTLNDLDELEVALEGKLDRELFAFVEEVKNTLHKLDYRNTTPLELLSYTPGIPTLKFSRNKEGSITIEVSSFVDESKPYTLVGDMSTISNLRICIKNEFGIFKKERMKYHESELNRTFNRIDHVDAQ